MSCREGFTLLELNVAVLLLTLLVLGFTQLVKAQESMVVDMETWIEGDPVYYVVPPQDPFERALGTSSALSDDPPPPPPGPDTTEYANRVTLESVTRDLAPPRAEAIVLVEEIEDE